MANLMTTCQFGMDNDTADSDTVSALSALSEYRWVVASNNIYPQPLIMMMQS